MTLEIGRPTMQFPFSMRGNILTELWCRQPTRTFPNLTRTRYHIIYSIIRWHVRGGLFEYNAHSLTLSVDVKPKSKEHWLFLKRTKNPSGPMTCSQPSWPIANSFWFSSKNRQPAMLIASSQSFLNSTKSTPSWSPKSTGLLTISFSTTQNSVQHQNVHCCHWLTSKIPKQKGGSASTAGYEWTNEWYSYT